MINNNLVITYENGEPQIDYGNGNIFKFSHDVAGKYERGKRQSHIDYLISQVESGIFPATKEQAIAIFEEFAIQISSYINTGK
jgi:hypothetical protein